MVLWREAFGPNRVLVARRSRQISFGETGAPEIRTIKDRSTKAGPANVGIAKLSLRKIRPIEYSVSHECS